MTLKIYMSEVVGEYSSIQLSSWFSCS